MLDLRLLGVNRRVPLSCFRWVVPVAVIGLIVNVITGAMLFMKSATVYGSSTPFFVKMALVLIGAATLAPLLAQVRRDDADNNNEVSGRLRLLATASILVWTAAVTVGRLLAYPHLLFQ
jgi:uncharacterized membrane protein